MKTNIIIHLINYWSQITVLLGVIFGGIGFILKLFLNWEVKKKEITFIKIRETKIKELREFYSSYINLEILLKSLHFASGQNKNEYESELRKKLPEAWRKFYLDLTFLRIFLSSDELVLFEDLHKELENIQLKIDFHKIDKEFDYHDIELRRELRHIRDDIFPKRIPHLLRKIEMNLKKDFEIK